MELTKDNVESKLKFINGDYYHQPITSKVFIQTGDDIIAGHPDSWIFGIFRGNESKGIVAVDTHGEACAFLRGIESMLK